MNQELIDKEIIEQELKEYLDGAYADYGSAKDQLERFAKLVAAAEREACVQDIQMHIPRSGRDTTEYQRAMRMIKQIRARGETK